MVESGHEDLAKLIEENTKQMKETPRKDTLGYSSDSLKRTKDRIGETMHPVIPQQRILQSKANPKRLCLSDGATTDEHNDGNESLTYELHSINGTSNTENRSADSDRIPSPISVSSDDHSCIQASRLDRELDFSDSDDDPFLWMNNNDHN